MRARILAALPIVLLAALAPAGAPAQDNWPARPIRFVVPSSPSGGTDLYARLLAQALREPLRQEIVVENRPGGRAKLHALRGQHTRPGHAQRVVILDGPQPEVLQVIFRLVHAFRQMHVHRHVQLQAERESLADEIGRAGEGGVKAHQAGDQAAGRTGGAYEIRVLLQAQLTVFRADHFSEDTPQAQGVHLYRGLPRQRKNARPGRVHAGTRGSYHERL